MPTQTPQPQVAANRETQIAALAAYEYAVAAYNFHQTSEGDALCTRLLDSLYEMGALNQRGEVALWLDDEERDELASIYPNESQRLNPNWLPRT